MSQAAATPLPDSNDAADALASPVLPGTRGFGGVAGPRGQQSARGSQEELQAGLEVGAVCTALPCPMRLELPAAHVLQYLWGNQRRACVWEWGCGGGMVWCRNKGMASWHWLE